MLAEMTADTRGHLQVKTVKIDGAAYGFNVKRPVNKTADSFVAISP